jgi:hypothetical protein
MRPGHMLRAMGIKSAVQFMRRLRQQPTEDDWEPVWPLAYRETALFLKNGRGPVVIAIIGAGMGAAGGAIVGSAGWLGAALGAVLGVLIGLLIFCLLVFLRNGIVAVRQQRNEVRNEYDRVIRPRMVPLSERQIRVASLTQQGRHLLDWARKIDPSDLGEVDRLWAEAHLWEAATEAALRQMGGLPMGGLTVRPQWLSHVKSLSNPDDLVRHIDRELGLLGALIARMPPILLSGELGEGPLPADVATAWQEAQASYTVGAWTPSEMMFRKIFVHVMVDTKRSPPGQTFVQYLDDLQADLGSLGWSSRRHYPRRYLTTLSGWIDGVRQHAHVAGENLTVSTAQDCDLIRAVTKHLLEIAYDLSRR